MPKPIKTSFFQEKLSQKKVFSILLTFLQGTYYGDNLERIKDYLSNQIAPLYQINNPDVILYRAMLAILSVTDLKREYKTVLDAIDQIYKSIYMRRDTENPHIIELMQNKYFRYLLARSLTLYWQSPVSAVTPETLLNMKSEFLSYKRLFPIGTTLLRIEAEINKVFSHQASLEEIYDLACIMIDLSVACRMPASTINSLMIAGLCFQIASLREESPAHVMAAERIALELYQTAIRCAFDAMPVVTLYTSTHVAKFLSEFRFDQSTMTLQELLENLSQKLLQPGDAEAAASHSGSVLESMQGAIKRALYLIDIMPFYSAPQSSLDIEIIEIYQLGLMRTSLNTLLNQTPMIDHERAKVLYHAYEDAILYRFSGRFVNQEAENEKAQLKLQAIEALLEKDGQSITSMAKLIDTPFINMSRDTEGWLEPINELDFPDEAGVTIYKSFDGFSINHKTGEFQWICSKWEATDPRSRRLFTSYDNAQMIEKGIAGAFFSLDHVDPTKQYHPLQKERFSPPELYDTECLETLFMTDYLLKMFTTGTEISGRPPYLTRSTEKMLARLPEYLRKILNLCRDGKHEKSQSHRFWITAGEIEVQEKTEGDVTTFYFGDIKMKIQKHLLQYNTNGDLEDSKTKEDDTSKEAEFARKMEAEYEHIGDFFPEFLRLKEFSKISAAIKKLKIMREINRLEMEGNTKLLADQARWNEIYTEVLNDKTPLLLKSYQQFPKFTFQLNDPEVVLAYNTRYNEIYAEEKALNLARGLTWIEGTHSAQLAQAINQQFTQQIVLNHKNAQGTAYYSQIRQQLFNAHIDVQSKLGAAGYEAAINDFMNGNVGPLAQGIARDIIDFNKAHVRNEIVGKQNLEAQFKAMQFDSAPKPLEQITNLRVPSVFDRRSGRYVYGGVDMQPVISKVNQLSLSLNVGSTDYMRTRSIEDATRLVDSYRHSALSTSVSVTNLGFNAVRNKIHQLEVDLRTARSDLSAQPLQGFQSTLGVNPTFFPARERLLQETMATVFTPVTPANATQINPFLATRLERDLRRQVDHTKESVRVLTQLREAEAVKTVARATSFAEPSRTQDAASRLLDQLNTPTASVPMTTTRQTAAPTQDASSSTSGPSISSSQPPSGSNSNGSDGKRKEKKESAHFATAPLFHSIYRDASSPTFSPPSSPIKILSTEEIRKLPGRCNCIYVIMGNGDIRIALHRLEEERWTGRNVLTHEELAMGEPVKGAGTAIFNNGILEYIDEESGHYHPYGEHLRPLSEDCLIEIGFPEATGKFQYKVSLGIKPEERKSILTYPAVVDSLESSNQSVNLPTSSVRKYILSVDEVKAMPDEQTLRYAIYELGKIIFTPLSIPEEEVKNLGFIHTSRSLGSQAPIISSGVVHIKDGTITYIDEQAVRPNPSGKLTEICFKEKGFNYTADTVIECKATTSLLGEQSTSSSQLRQSSAALATSGHFSASIDAGQSSSTNDKIKTP